MRIVVLFLLCINQLGLAAENTLYRWQDTQGQWHFGDAASSNGQSANIVNTPASTQNVVTIPTLKPLKNKATPKKRQPQAKNNPKKTKKKPIETLNQKKWRCNKKRDELRFKALNNEERNQYDRECVSEIRW